MTEFNVQALADSIAELVAQDGPTPSIRVAEQMALMAMARAYTGGSS